MKLFFAFAIIAVVLTVVFGAPDAWNEYKTKHGKKYSATEDAQRKKNFLATDATITKHNSQKNVTYQLGHNQFSDWTPKQLSTLIQEAVKPANVTRSLESMETFDVEARRLPIKLSYRGKACLAPVRNQGGCNSGWAFAAITPLEFAWCKKYGSLLALSEQQLLDCNPYGYGCGGGLSSFGWLHLQQAGGSAKRSLYPLAAVNSQTCKFKSSMIGAKISSYNSTFVNNHYITNLRSNSAKMQAALQTYGPLASYITVTNSFWAYKGGIYNDVACDNLPYNHGVVIVGYGTRGIDFWIVRNSWGTEWGDEGYMLIERGVNKCKIEQFPSAILSVV